MKKIICVDNQKDLVEALGSPSKQAIIIDCLLIDNLGLILLKQTITHYYLHSHTIILKTNSSLPYLIFAIENDFKLIITTLKNINIEPYKELAQNKETKIFNFTQDIFKC